MESKICMVTGATSGIGQVTARELARQGATVIVVGRSRERSEATVNRIKQQTDNPNVEYRLADLSVQKDIHQLAQEFKHKYQRLHVLVNNAGAIFLRRLESADGIEMTFALNHLNYFLLTHLLLDTLKASAPARIINVSSRAHARVSGLNFDDLQNKRGYGMNVYGQSKLMNVLFTYELARRLEGTGIMVNALHPGFVATRFATNNGLLVRLARPVLDLFALSAEEGAQTMIYLATSPEVEGVTGKYFVKEKAVLSSPASYDEAAARRLWQISEKMTSLPVAG
ncbi:MAG: Short-chain dehydrogenase [Anaerolineales bacterium]|nr:Short-chain dehydrogenase [Anaerolineales bacterium]